MKVVFFGSSNYCLPVLEALKKDLALVVTREDKPVGRKQILTPSATKLWAKENNIPVATELNIDCDLAIVADYGKKITEDVLNRPHLGTFNIHFSLLPRLRGTSPVQTAILNGEGKTGITIFKIDKDFDTGPILWQREYSILPTETAGELYTRLFDEAAKEISKIDFSGKLAPQDNSQATFCKKLTKDDGFVKLDDPNIYNKYRAYYPWPGIWTLKDGKRMKILKCHLEGEKLLLDQIQFEGKNPQ